MTREELKASLNIEENIIPSGRKNRPGSIIVPGFITIHNTDNTSPGADARSHGRFLINPGYYKLNGKPHWVSWHYTVDDKRVVKHLPVNEKAFHAVNGNGQSIGIEICMHQGIDQSKAFQNAARLAALLLNDLESLKKDVSKVVPHKFWTGKDCPRLLLDDGNVLGKKWNEFLDSVSTVLSSIESAGTEMLLGPGKTLAQDMELAELVVDQEPGNFHVDVEEDAQEHGGMVHIERELHYEIMNQAKERGVEADVLINLWLQQKLNECAVIGKI